MKIKRLFLRQFALLILLLVGILTYLLFFSNLYPKKKTFIQIPFITLNHSGKVCIKACIEEHPYLLKLDTGASGFFSFPKKVLLKLQKKKVGKNLEWFDLHGNLHSSPTYILEKADLGKLKCTEISTDEEPEEFVTKWSHLSPVTEVDLSGQEVLDKEVGRIGVGLLRKMDFWLLDFPKSCLLSIRDLKKFEKDFRFSYSAFSKAPINNWRNLILLDVETEFGMKKFVLDTGSTYTVLKKPDIGSTEHECVELAQFRMNGIDFGPRKVHICDLSSVFEFDGILGLDFLKDRAIILDFKNNQLFIGPIEALN